MKEKTAEEKRSINETYFVDEQSAAYVYGEDTERILNVMAKRFIGENPPMPYQFRGYRNGHIMQDEKGKVRFDFNRLFPHAQLEEKGIAVGELWCAREKNSRFYFECDNGTTVYLNRECVFFSDGTDEPRIIPVHLKEGFNRFVIVSEKSPNGFSCTLQNCMPQWEPCCYVMPFREWVGEAGFLYALLSKEEIGEEYKSDIRILGGKEEFWEKYGSTTDIRWYPEANETEKKIGEKGGWTCVWQKVTADGTALKEEALFYQLKQIQRSHPAVMEIAIDGETEWDNIQPSMIHEIVWNIKTENGQGIASTIFRMEKPWKAVKPIEIKANCGPMLILEELTEEMAKDLIKWKPSGEELLTKTLELTKEMKFWNTDRVGMTVRPYVESNLYGRWTYPLGVTLYGMKEYGEWFHNQEVKEYVKDFVYQVIGADPYAEYDKRKYGFPGIHQQLLWLDALDDCGSFGACMLEEYLTVDEAARHTVWKNAEKIAQRVGNYILNEQVRCMDGAFRRRDNTMWVDDMYMSVPFLIRYSEVTGRIEGMEEACRQLLLYRDYFRMESEEKDRAYLLSHMYDLGKPDANQIPWSRGNGWVFFSLSELLMKLPENHRKREELLRFFRALCRGYLKVQERNGLWHQILDDSGTYIETSGSAMFLCAMARGIRFVWFDDREREEIISSVFRGWKGMIQEGIDRAGNLYGVCQGSGWAYERKYYRQLSWKFNDTHGIGIVMLAGTEVEKMKHYLAEKEEGFES